MTGIVPRPEAVARPRDPHKDRSTGLPVGHVREAALEAGIDEPYVQHALIEHGLGTGKLTAPPAVPTPAAPTSAAEQRSRWYHASLQVATMVDVKGEIPARDVERLINVLRDETGTMGHAVAKTRELVWWTGGHGARLDVAVVPAEDRTSIRITKSVRRNALVAVATSLLIVGPFSGLSIGAALAEMVGGDGGEVLGVLTGMASGSAVAWWTARRAVRWLRTRAEQGTRKLADRLADKVRDSLR
ncbi:MAG: hypothetical protein ABIZ91_09950 [Gemmatimonadaceae bacterium]